MDFIKKLFESAEEGVLNYDQFKTAASDAGIKLANLSDGNYVSKKKYDDDLKAKEGQITTLNDTITERDKDLASIKDQLDKAGVDASKLDKLSSDMEALQSKYDTDVKEYQTKLAKQEYEFAVKEFANSKNFTSNAAKRDFVNSMVAKGLTMENGKILGAEDFVSAYSTDNADAFVVEEDPDTDKGKPQDKPKPKFVDPTPGPDGGDEGDSFAFNFVGVRPKE